MLVIGELINGMYQNVKKAIQAKDKSAIQKLAKDQVAAGADVLDVNVGPASADPKAAMKWLVQSIREAVNAPLSIDSTKADVIEEGLKIAGKGSTINSTSADDERLNVLLPMAKKYDANVIALTMDKAGVPRDINKKAELALKIIASSMEHGVELEKIYIDPIVLPVNVAQEHCGELLEAIREFQVLCSPAPKTIVGLSNVSQRALERSLINRTYLVMAIANGLSAAIMDPLDKDLMDAMITAELILNKNIYCDSYLEAYRKK